MRRTNLFSALLLLTLATCAWSAPEKLVVSFFGSKTCGDCLEIKERLLKPLAQHHADVLEVRFHEFEDDSSLQLMLQLEKLFGVTKPSPQELFLPDTFLLGYEAIMADGETLIEHHLANPRTWSAKAQSSEAVDVGDFLKMKSGGWGFFLGTLATGLADGVNPCAIATMIFLISFLATRKHGRTQILLIGLVFTSTVYATYFAMGIGLKEVLDQIKGYYIVSQCIRWGAFTLAAVVAFLSFRDAVVYWRTGQAKDISLQLPNAVKMRIHKIISGNLGGASLVIGSIITGFLVTLLEAICTGQMYVPYIVAMTRQDSLRLRGLSYLAFYNFLFVLPLLIVMVLAYFGLKWNVLAKKTQQNMVVLKITLGLVMTGLAVYLVWPH